MRIGKVSPADGLHVGLHHGGALPEEQPSVSQENVQLGVASGFPVGKMNDAGAEKLVECGETAFASNGLSRRTGGTNCQKQR